MVSYLLTGLLSNYLRTDASHATVALPIGGRMIAASVRDWRVKGERFGGNGHAAVAPVQVADNVWGQAMGGPTLYKLRLGAFEARLKVMDKSSAEYGLNVTLSRADHVHAVKAA